MRLDWPNPYICTHGYVHGEAHSCDDQTDNLCWDRGPRIGDEGIARCGRRKGHEEAHATSVQSGFRETWATSWGVVS